MRFLRNCVRWVSVGRLSHGGGQGGGSGGPGGSQHHRSSGAVISPARSSADLFASRAELSRAKRVVVKLGTAVITREDECGLALGRLATVVESVSELRQQDLEVIIVTSGAVAFGKQRLRYESMMSQTVRQTLSPKALGPLDPRACAAAGQSGLMALYGAMFDQYGISCAQILVTKPDFQDAQARLAVRHTIDELLQMGIVPICNENDVMSQKTSEGADLHGVISVTDNDALAALLAVEVGADLLVILSDVSGIFSAPPGDASARLLHTFRPGVDQVSFGGKSRVGRGGMEAKIKSAEWALRHGCNVVIANGHQYRALSDIMAGQEIGTFFTLAENVPPSMENVTDGVRAASRQLLTAPVDKRAAVISRLATLLMEKKDAILAANKADVSDALSANIGDALVSRLRLTEAKLQSLATGLVQIAQTARNVVGRVLRRTELSPGLILEQETVPLGVVLMIFESRPDALPQVAALAIASCNGIIMKGGKEAGRSNAILHSLVSQALEEQGFRHEACVLVKERETVRDLLRLHKHIDLVIPRGSNAMVRSIQQQTKIPVLGHAEGVCHVYVDESADADKAWAIVRDSKCDYPAACNAMETLLVHKSHASTLLPLLIRKLESEGVTVRVGPRVAREACGDDKPLVSSFKVEYSMLECAVEIVDSVQDAIAHINQFSSSHTDAIVTEKVRNAELFLSQVDSACVFHNASTRFADGYRFGLGAELGISTERIHARGPVGVEGLLTSRWRLIGDGHTAQLFAKGEKQFTHKTLSVE